MNLSSTINLLNMANILKNKIPLRKKKIKLCTTIKI